MSVQIAHDLDADALYITLSDEPVARTVDIEDCTMVDLDADGNLVGIEVISPRRSWPLQKITQAYEIEDDDAAMLKELYGGHSDARAEQVSPAPVQASVA